MKITSKLVYQLIIVILALLAVSIWISSRSDNTLVENKTSKEELTIKELSLNEIDVIEEYHFLDQYKIIEDGLFKQYVPPPGYTNYIRMYRSGDLDGFNIQRSEYKWNYTIAPQQEILDEIEKKLLSEKWGCISNQKIIKTNNTDGCLYLVNY